MRIDPHRAKPLWLVPYSFLALEMVHAMVEYSASLLARRPRARRNPAAPRELRARLLELNRPARPHPLVEGADCDLEVRVATEPPSPAGRFAFGGDGSRVHIRILLEEKRREVRINQTSHSYAFFPGLRAWLPGIGGHYAFHSGPPDQGLITEVYRVAGGMKWGVRPVVWWFQATYKGVQALERLTPAPFRSWPARRFWGMRYPLSYLLGIGDIAVLISPLDTRTLLLILGISAAWWGVWSALIWALLGFSAFWRRRHS